MFRCGSKIVSTFILFVLIAASLIYTANSQNTTAAKEPGVTAQDNTGKVNNATVNPNSPKIISTVPITFDRWAISFQYSGEWKEWPNEKTVAAKASLNDELKPFNIEMLEFTMMLAPNEDAALLISKSKRASPITAEEVLKERESVYKDAQAAGDLSKINRLEKITIDGKPAVIEDVERANDGRAMSIKIISGQVISEVSVVTKLKDDFPIYKPVFDKILQTVKVKE